MQGFRATVCTIAHTLLSGAYTRGVGMPDADGNFKGMSVPAEAWERVFGQGELFERQSPSFDELVPPLPEEPGEQE